MPTVVMAHGFSCLKEMFLDKYAETFAAAGLGVLVYDNRNFGDSDGMPRQEVDPWGQIHDYRHAITYASTLPEVDADRKTRQYRRPAVLDDTGLIVTHIDEKGQQLAVYDFDELNGYLPLKRSLAAAFARHVRAGGPWRSVATSKEMWTLIGTFTRFLVAHERPPHDLCDITPAMWHHWRISRPTGEIGRRQIGKVGAFLRADPQLPAATRDGTLKRITKTPGTETAYTTEQFAVIKTTATQNFRKAWQRIHANRQHLAILGR